MFQVVDSADKERLRICKEELQRLLKEEKLAGATLLILANKQDLPGALTAAEIKKVGPGAARVHVTLGAQVVHVHWL